VSTWAAPDGPRRQVLGPLSRAGYFAAAQLQDGLPGPGPGPGPAGRLCHHGLHLMGHVAIASWAGLRYPSQLAPVSRVLFLLSTSLRLCLLVTNLLV